MGSGCRAFEIRKIGEDYFSFFEDCVDPKACTILLRGGSRDVLMELERNLQDAMQVARNVVFEPKLLPGGGAVEMAISVGLAERARTLEGVELWPFKAVGSALEVIPRTLAQNAGADVVRLLTEMRARKSSGGEPNLGIDGIKGTLVDMKGPGGVLDPFAVRTQTIKSAIESACMLLRIGALMLQCSALWAIRCVSCSPLKCPPPHTHSHTHALSRTRTRTRTRTPCICLPPDDILTGHRNKQHDPAGREDKRPAEEQDEDKAGGAIGED